MNNVGQNIMRLRKRYRMNQVILAVKLGVSKQSVSNWESGRKSPRMTMLQRLSDVFNVEITELTKENNSNHHSGILKEYNEPTINNIVNISMNLTPDRMEDTYNFALRKLHEQGKD